jgi:hypothetical protein
MQIYWEKIVGKESDEGKKIIHNTFVSLLKLPFEDGHESDLNALTNLVAEIRKTLPHSG